MPMSPASPNPLPDGSPDRRLKILVVTTKSPYPLFEGRALRTYHLIRQAAQQHEVHLLSFVQTPEDLAGIEHMRGICQVVAFEKLYFEHGKAWLAFDALRELFSRSPLQVMKYRSGGMQRRMAQMLAEHDYDLVHLDMVHLAEYMALCGARPRLLMVHNVESMILQRRAETQADWPRRTYLRYQFAKLAAFEAQACRDADRVVAVSEIDAQQLSRMSGVQRIAAVPNGVDTRYFKAGEMADAAGPPNAPADEPVAAQPDSMVFVGGFSWYPNRDAIDYFCQEILPLIVAERPQASLTVIGGQPPGATEAFAARFGSAPVRLLGRIDDIRPVVAAAAIYIVPLRIGGGTRLKILDALAMSKAIVSTSIGAEGLATRAGEEIVLADTPQEFARQVIALLADPQQARRLGANGRALAERQYDWDVIGHGLRRIYRELVTPPSA